MKLFNVVTVWDIYVTAETGEAARACALEWIRHPEEPIDPSESVALEAREERNVRAAWRDQKPLVGSDISDDDFENHVKGNTTIQVFKKIYTKDK
jgi:hypothetical protein